MGQDKKELTKLLQFVKEIYDHPDNSEFAAGIQDLVLSDLKMGKKSDWSRQISEIYELCLRKNLQEQAEDLYKDFPIIDISAELVDLFIEMENARRYNDFDSFGFFLFQQVELIVNTIIKSSKLGDIYLEYRSLPPFTFTDKETRLKRRSTDKASRFKTIEEFVLIPDKDGEYRSAGRSLSELNTNEKIRTVIYFIVHKGNIPLYYLPYKEEFNTLLAISCIRNHYAHSGGTTTDYQKQVYKVVSTDKTKNYLLSLGFLHGFIKGITDNYPQLDRLFSITGESSQNNQKG
jgi:hypothetical protein